MTVTGKKRIHIFFYIIYIHTILDMFLFNMHIQMIQYFNLKSLQEWSSSPAAFKRTPLFTPQEIVSASDFPEEKVFYYAEVP